MSHYNRDYLIVANGPFLPRDIIIEALGQNKMIVALDEAALKLTALGIKPDIILGDFDLIEKSITRLVKFFGVKADQAVSTNHFEQYVGKYHIQIVKAGNQNATDLQKAIIFCDQQGATNIDILCATAGRMDHHENTIRTLKKMHKVNRALSVHTEYQSLEFVQDRTVTLEGEVGDYCGIFATPSCQFFSPNEGLAWSHTAENGPFLLDYTNFNSVSNQLTRKSAVLEILGEALIVHPPRFKAQRSFYALSDEEKAQRLYQQYQQTLLELPLSALKKLHQAGIFIEPICEELENALFGVNKEQLKKILSCLRTHTTVWGK